jgi:tRNA(Ile)-lysidine synthase
VLIALSGGLDSSVLLHAAASAQLPQPLLSIHINHGLSPNAGNWQQHCEVLCRSMALPFICESVTVVPDGTGLEQAARAARYRAFEQHLRPGDLVLMAHHRTDQVETFFLRLVRGAGPSGLAAMSELRDWGPARLGRPFLGLDRDSLLAYARFHELSWIQDESNADERFDRNYLRLRVLPELQLRWPGFSARVTRASELCRETVQLLEEYAAQDLKECEPRLERVGASLLADPLRRWSEPRRHSVVRHWLQMRGFRNPAQKQLAQLTHLLAAAADQNPLLDWGDCEMRRFDDRVYCLPRGWNRTLFHPRNAELAANICLDLADGTCLQTSIGQPGLASGHYRVLPRSAVPSLKRGHPSQRHRSQTLKNLLQEFRLEPWLRDRVPLVMSGDQLVGVADLWVEEAFICRGADALQLRWEWCGNSRGLDCRSL